MSLTTSTDTLVLRKLIASTDPNGQSALDFRVIYKMAFDQGDLVSLGLIAIHSLVYAGAQGSILNTPMDVVNELVKAKSSQLNGLALKLGKGLVKHLHTRPEVEDEVINTSLKKIHTSRETLRKNLTVKEGVAFFQMILMNSLRDVLKSKKEISKKRVDVEDIDTIINHNEWDKIPKFDLTEFLDAIDDDPDMWGDDGLPRMSVYIQGIANEKTDRQIAEVLHISPPGLKQWVDKRKHKLVDHLTSVMSKNASAEVEASAVEAREVVIARKLASTIAAN